MGFERMIYDQSPTRVSLQLVMDRAFNTIMTSVGCKPLYTRRFPRVSRIQRFSVASSFIRNFTIMKITSAMMTNSRSTPPKSPTRNFTGPA
jgi:hypothetical protein